LKRSRITNNRINSWLKGDGNGALDTTGQETTLNQETAARSPAAERMRLHRQRRRMDLRCIVVELRETEVDELVRRGLLTEDTRRLALRHAVHSHFDQTLTPPNRWSTN
jgi:hypothetical protein